MEETTNKLQMMQIALNKEAHRQFLFKNIFNGGNRNTLQVVILLSFAFVLFSCESPKNSSEGNFNEIGFDKVKISNSPVKVYDVLRLNDPISQYNWQNWNKSSYLTPPYDFNFTYSLSNDKSEFSKFNGVIFEPIEVFVVNDTIYKVELTALSYIKDRPSSHPRIVLNKFKIDEVIEIFKERFGSVFNHTKSVDDTKQEEEYRWDFSNYTVSIMTNSDVIDFFIPHNKEKFDKEEAEFRNKKSSLMEELQNSLKQNDINEGYYSKHPIHSLSITFTSKYMELVQEEMYRKINESFTNQNSTNKKKALDKL